MARGSGLRDRAGQRETSKTDVEEDEMWKATKARRALFGFLLIIAFVLGYQEEFMSQAKADGGIKERAARTRGVRRRFRMAVRGNWSWATSG